MARPRRIQLGGSEPTRTPDLGTPPPDLTTDELLTVLRTPVRVKDTVTGEAVILGIPESLRVYNRRIRKQADEHGTGLQRRAWAAFVSRVVLLSEELIWERSNRLSGGDLD